MVIQKPVEMFEDAGYLKEMFLCVGSEEEWLDAVRDDDSKLAFTLFEYFPKDSNKRITKRVRLLTVSCW